MQNLALWQEIRYLYGVADRLDKLIENMRSQGLARTIYKASDFESGGSLIIEGLMPWEVIDLPFGRGEPPRISPDCTRFSVGALDLRNHKDAFFTPGFSASRLQLPGA